MSYSCREGGDSLQNYFGAVVKQWNRMQARKLLSLTFYFITCLTAWGSTQIPLGLIFPVVSRDTLLPWEQKTADMPVDTSILWKQAEPNVVCLCLNWEQVCQYYTKLILSKYLVICDRGESYRGVMPVCFSTETEMERWDLAWQQGWKNPHSLRSVVYCVRSTWVFMPRAAYTYLTHHSCQWLLWGPLGWGKVILGSQCLLLEEWDCIHWSSPTSVT